MIKEEYNVVTLSLPKPPSLNAFYAGKHWMIRKKHKESYSNSIKEALDKYDLFTAERFAVDVEYNARYDVDNAIICCKFVADYLTAHEYVLDDKPKIFFRQSTTFNPELNKNEFLCKLILYGYQTRE